MTDTTDRLKSQVKNLSRAQKEIEAELRAEDVAKEYESVLGEYAGRAKLKGFRPGKAPLEMVKQTFAPEIRKSVLDALIPRILGEILESNSIHPVGTPVVEDIAYNEGHPLRFKAIVEVWPNFDLPAYKKIKVRKMEAVVSAEDIEHALDDLRRKSAEYLPVEGRGAADGDYVVVEFQGKDIKTKRLMPAEKVVILAGHEGNDPAINANLAGLKPQEEKNFDYSYPRDFKNKKLAGKEVEYRLKVVSVKEMRIPEANDDFAKTLGEFDSLAALKDKIQGEIQAAKDQAVRRDTADEILKTVLDSLSADLPPSVVEDEAEAVLRKALSSAPRQNWSRDAVDALQASARKQAEANLKRHLLLTRIAEAEGIAVGDEEIDEEIKTLAQANNLSLAQARDAFNQEGRRENLKTNLLFRKTVDFLVEQAIIE